MVIEATITVTHMSRFQRGTKINIKYNPADKTKVVLNGSIR